MFLFNKSIFPLLEEYFKTFLDNSDDLESAECLISTFVDDMIKDGTITLNYVSTNSKWYGITFREDLPMVKDGIEKMIEAGEYKKNLWG